MKSFEERLERLEALNEKIAEGNIPLEAAVALFEEGIRLARGLEKELSKIERRIEILVNDTQVDESDDQPNLALFPELENEEG